MTAIIALILKLVGVGFLIVAGIGVIRFSDAFQRMHAATKAGTLGAGLVVMGTIVSHGTTQATVMGALTVLFLLLTVPVAGHLLGRASYISGADMTALKGKDALDGVLERQDQSLEQRLLYLPPSVSAILTGDAPSQRTGVERSAYALGNLTEVKVGIIYDHVQTVFPRALSVAKTNRAHISAHVLIDSQAIETARDPKTTRNAIRERAAQAMGEIEALKGGRSVRLAVTYEEGDPRTLLAEADNSALLVVPRKGWFHHGNDDPRPGTSWEPDGLLHLPNYHQGPVMFAGVKTEASGQIVVHDRSEPHLVDVLDWALLSALWDTLDVIVVGSGDEKRKAEFEAICAHHEVGVRFVDHENAEDSILPRELADADAIIGGSLPQPLRTSWYGHFWYDRLIPGFDGDILLAAHKG